MGLEPEKQIEVTHFTSLRITYLLQDLVQKKNWLNLPAFTDDESAFSRALHTHKMHAACPEAHQAQVFITSMDKTEIKVEVIVPYVYSISFTECATFLNH